MSTSGADAEGVGLSAGDACVLSATCRDSSSAKNMPVNSPCDDPDWGDADSNSQATASRVYYTRRDEQAHRYRKSGRCILSVNPIQPRPVLRNLDVDLVRLAGDAVDVLVLTLQLFTHGLPKEIECSCAAVDGLEIVCTGSRLAHLA